MGVSIYSRSIPFNENPPSTSPVKASQAFANASGSCPSKLSRTAATARGFFFLVCSDVVSRITSSTTASIPELRASSLSCCQTFRWASGRGNGGGLMSASCCTMPGLSSMNLSAMMQPKEFAMSTAGLDLVIPACENTPARSAASESTLTTLNGWVGLSPWPSKSNRCTVMCLSSPS